MHRWWNSSRSQVMQTAAAKILDYPRNAWYVAAWSYEITRKPLARRSAADPSRSTARRTAAR